MSQNLDPELPSIYIRQSISLPEIRWKEHGWSEEEFAAQLVLSGRIVQSVGGRLGTFEGVNSNPPYIVWNTRDDINGVVRTAKSSRGEIARKRAICTIKRIDVFASGQGSFSPARPTYDDLLSALISLPATPIYSAAGFLGTVTQTRFRRDVKTSTIDKTTQALTTELGFEFELTYERN